MATYLDQVRTQNLKCPLCFDLFDEPKQLACMHSYCKDCLLRLYESQSENNNLLCPVCRKITTLKEGDVSTLQTNISIKSLVEDVKNTHQKGKQICTQCDSDEKPLAETYCQECEEYLCASCHQTHAKWKKLSGHEVITVHDIISGKSSIQKRHKCNKHPSEEEQFVCIDCKKCICFRCRVLDHEKIRHHVVEVTEHERFRKENIESMRHQANTKKTEINKYIDFIKEQQDELNALMEQQTKEIDETYEEFVQQLKEKRDMLINEYTQQINAQHSKLDSLKGAYCKQITSINSASELVDNGMKVPLQDQVLTVHHTLCDELQMLLDKREPDYSLPRNVSVNAKEMAFHRNMNRNELELGKIGIAEWLLRRATTLPENNMNGMASMPDGKIAVGYHTGGIQPFYVDGPQETLMKDVYILDLSFLSDGRYVFRDETNNISLYTPQCEKLDVQFDTLSHDEGGLGGLDVDKEDNIYTSYRKVKKIRVFQPTGGQAVREVACGGFDPWQIFAMNSNKMMLVTDGFTVQVIDESGAQKHDVTKDGVHAYPAVCHDNTILIAWVKNEDGLLAIEKYSHELKQIETLVTDYKIQISERCWYYVQEFVTGEIAFCTPDRLYIFHKSVTLSCV